MDHYNIRVKGKVQGVYFRANTQEKARSLGLNGWVRNEPDGSVYIEAEGAREQLDELVSWCRSGPENAVVKNVEVEEYAETMDNYKGFEIRHW